MQGSRRISPTAPHVLVGDVQPPNTEETTTVKDYIGCAPQRYCTVYAVDKAVEGDGGNGHACFADVVHISGQILVADTVAGIGAIYGVHRAIGPVSSHLGDEQHT